MAITANTQHAQYDLELTDGTTTVGLVLADGRGRRNPRAIKHIQTPSTALQTATSYPGRSDRRVPFLSLEQDTWEGGRGNEFFAKDTTRYYDNWRANPSRGDRIISGALESYATGLYSTQVFDLQEERYFVQLTGGNAYLARSFTPTSSYTTPTFLVWVENRLKTDAVYLGIYSDTGGQPGALLGTAAKTTNSDASPLMTLEVALAPGTSLTAGTTYHAVFWFVEDEHAVTDLASNNFSSYGAVACEYESGGWASSDGSTWTASDWRPVFVLYEGNGYNKTPFRMFTYRGALYGYTQPTSGNSFLYINGDRGVADSNSSDLTKLNDATKSWTTNEWVGSIVKIIYGPGVDEEQPWRVITANDATSLTVSPAWEIAHDATQTEYVIVRTDKWTQLLDLGGRVTDHAVAGDYVYFARGDQDSDPRVLRYQGYNNSGTWTERSATEDTYQASILRARYDSTHKRFELWGVNNEDDFGNRLVWRGLVPKAWYDLYNDDGELAPTDVAWTDVAATNVTQDAWRGLTRFVISASFTTGLVGQLNVSSFDLTGSTFLTVQVLSSVAAAAGDFTLSYGDGTNWTDLALPALPAGVWQWITLEIAPTAHTAPDGSAVTAVKLTRNTNLGYQTFYFANGIRAGHRALDFTMLYGNARIKNILFWNGNPSIPADNPWVFTEDGVFEIQTQNNNTVVAIPNSELKAMADYRNGRVAITHDVYAYFALHNGLERIYQNSLVDMGLDRDGLPYNRSGPIIDAVGWAGGIFFAVDGGDSGYSAIYHYAGGGWHEYYRAPRAGERITGLALQAIPGDYVDRLWFCMGGHVMWLPFDKDPARNKDFKFAHDGSIDLSYLTGSLVDTQKMFDKLKIVTHRRDQDLQAAVDADYPNLQTGKTGSTLGDWIEVYYRLDVDSNTAYPWHYIGTLSPSADSDGILQMSLVDAAGDKLVGTRLQIKLRLRCEQLPNPIDIRSTIVDLIEKFETTDGFSVLYLIQDGHPTLQGQMKYTMAKTDWDQLNAWRDTPTQLTMRSKIKAFDGKTVQIVSNQGTPHLVDYAGDRESIIGELRLIETA